MNDSTQWARVVHAASRSAAGLDAERRSELLDEVLAVGARLTPDGAGCSITMEVDDGFETPAASNDLALRLDHAQYRSDDGPCVAACRDGEPHSIVIMSEEPGFREFTATAVRYDVRSSLSLPLAGPRPAALNLYAHTPYAFTAESDRAKAVLLARCAARFLPGAQGTAAGASERLRAAQERGRVVRRAQQLLAGPDGDQQAAFRRLVDVSRFEQRSLADIAAGVVAQHPHQGPDGNPHG